MGRRWGQLLLWTVVACLIAGVYGALHNQVSYTVSPEYFHRFKFIQFRVHDAWQNRWGASVVGWKAAWWTGILFGPPMVIVALRRCAPPSFVRTMAAAFMIAVAVDAVCGLGALAVATALVNEQTERDVWMPHGVTDREAFLRAGLMHDASYAGGLLATIVGCSFITVMTRRPPSKVGG